MHSCNFQKALIALGEKLSSRLLHSPSWQYNRLAVKRLNGMLECWTICFLKNVGSNFDDVVRAHSQEELVEGRMVQPAEGQSVANDRLASWFRIGNNAGRIQQLTVSQMTEGTLMPIGEKYTLTKSALVQSATCQRRDIFASDLSNLSRGL